MREHVLLHIGMLRVAFAADRTHERTLAGVDALVLLQIGPLRKLLVADLAGKRLYLYQINMKNMIQITVSNNM